MLRSARTRAQEAIAPPALLRYTPAMAKRATADHGEIIHFAGRMHLFPVAAKADPAHVRLASRENLKSDEARIGWPEYFRPFIDRHLVFLYDETGGQAVTRAEADAALAQGPGGPGGAASPSPQ
jgi:hypothetical protein